MRSIPFIPVVLCILLLLVAPVAARIDVTGPQKNDITHTVYGEQTTTFDFIADPDERIAAISYGLPLDTRVDFTITYGTGSTVTGYMEYTPYLVALQSRSTVSLGGDTRTETFVDAQAAGYSLIQHVQISGHAINSSDSPPHPGFALYAQGYGLWSDEIVFYPVDDLQQNLMTRIQFTSNAPVDVAVALMPESVLSEHVSKSISQNIADSLGEASGTVREWLDIGLSVISILKDFVISTIYWLKFFFVDNLLMTVALYISITMAFAARASRGNIAKFLRTWFKDQVGLFKFIISLWQSLADLIGTVRGWFRL